LHESCGGVAYARAIDGHLDEIVVRIAGKRMYLWRAVDHEGEVLDMLVQRRRDKRAALLAHAQAPQETGLHAEITDDRQAGLLWSPPTRFRFRERAMG
jgi:transposase-like protein